MNYSVRGGQRLMKELKKNREGERAQEVQSVKVCRLN